MFLYHTSDTDMHSFNDGKIAIPKEIPSERKEKKLLFLEK